MEEAKLNPQKTPADPGSPDSKDEPPRIPVGEAIYQEIVARVLSSEIGPGDRITIDAIARELGVSQTPIREALHRLDADGIVVRNHLAGYRVAPKLDRAQFEELIELRLLLEPSAARLAATRMPSTALDEISSIHQAMTELLPDAARGYAEFSRLDSQFHDLIARSSGNRYVYDSIQRLHTHAHLFRLSRHALITTMAIDEHAAILSALQLRDEGEAAFSMREHIHASATRFRASF